MKNSASGTAMQDFVHLKKIEDEMVGQIEKITRAFGVPRIKAVMAKAKITDAVHIMAGTRAQNRVKQFDQVSRDNMIELIEELGSVRPCILLLRKEDGSGVVEMLTGKEYYFAS